MSKIEVLYNGNYPTTCMGTLIIKKDGKEIYKKEFCCHSTGSVSFDEEWNEQIESGKLIWNEEEAKNFSQEIQDKVKERLSECSVCCGGCV